ncbi:MAG: diguanylate cyclase domain-containing protein [Limnothrix sp. BL-A-16]
MQRLVQHPSVQSLGCGVDVDRSLGSTLYKRPIPRLFGDTVRDPQSLPDPAASSDPQALIEENKRLRQQVAALEQSNRDLQIALETTAIHGDCIENELQSTLSLYRRQQQRLQTILKQVAQQKRDLEWVLQTTIEHSSVIENELLSANERLTLEAHQHRNAEQKLQSLLGTITREREDLEHVLRLIIEHGDAMIEQLYVQATEAGAKATMDALTRVANRRRFDEYLEQQWQTRGSRSESLALVMVDVDSFKAYNDLLGHVAGDVCLQQVAMAIAQVARSTSDLVARYGGEEFAVLLPRATLQQAELVGTRIRQAVLGLSLPHPRSVVNPCVTVSVGVAAISPSLTTSPTLLVSRADRALYAAKQQGRDRVVVADELSNETIALRSAVEMRIH